MRDDTASVTAHRAPRSLREILESMAVYVANYPDSRVLSHADLEQVSACIREQRAALADMVSMAEEVSVIYELEDMKCSDLCGNTLCHAAGCIGQKMQGARAVLAKYALEKK